MQNTIDQYSHFYGTINSKFNSLGAIDTGRDGVFFGTPRPKIASQMVRIAKATGEPDGERVLDRLRPVYQEVERAIAGGLSGDSRDVLIDLLVGEIR